MIGCSAHFFYMWILIIYNNFVYFENQIENLPKHVGDKTDAKNGDAAEADSNKMSYSIMLLVGTIYPVCYDFA